MEASPRSEDMARHTTANVATISSREPTEQEEGCRDQHRAAYQVGLDGLLVAVTDPAPDWAGDAVGSVLQAKDEADIDRTETELAEDLRLQVD